MGSRTGKSLLTAAKDGDVEALRTLLGQGAEVDPVAPGEDSPLSYAAMYGHPEAARALLDAGANVNHRGQYGRSPLHYAVARSLELTSLLIERGADLRARNEGDDDVLDEHISRDDAAPEIAMRLLDAGFDLTMRPTMNYPGRSHLMLACFYGRLPLIELLLAAGVDPNEQSSHGSALEKARYSTKKKLVKTMLALLVKGGLAPTEAALNAVCEVGDLGSARLLLDRGADPNARGDGTPLTRAEASGNQVLVDLLLERGARPERPDLPPDAVRDEAMQAARKEPGASPRRLAWAEALAREGYRAAAASELAAAVRLGAAVPEALQARLEFENPPGTRWRFAAFEPATTGVAPMVDDAHFPGARVTSGARTLPLVIVLGPFCARCDERGETECTACRGTGTRNSALTFDHDEPCDPRERCTGCGGLKYVVNTSAFGKGKCRHRKPRLEMKVAGSSLSRCPACGLAALTTHGSWSDLYACGVCGQFSCRCNR